MVEVGGNEVVRVDAHDKQTKAKFSKAYIISLCLFLLCSLITNQIQYKEAGLFKM